MLSRIEHPCVSNGRIELDFLTLKVEKGKTARTATLNSERYRMWSPAYTVTSILIQLQGMSACVSFPDSTPGAMKSWGMESGNEAMSACVSFPDSTPGTIKSWGMESGNEAMSACVSFPDSTPGAIKSWGMESGNEAMSACVCLPASVVVVFSVYAAG